MPGIYFTYTMRRSLASPLGCPRLFGSLGPRLPLDLLGFGHREAARAGLGLSKVPQPGVDLVNMAAPPRGRARTIGTAALKSVLLSAARDKTRKPERRQQYRRRRRQRQREKVQGWRQSG